jgi:thiamine pyrophosphate-dependent acetolactate synthase large subunit-like protein
VHPTISIVGDLAFLMNMQEVVNVKALNTKNSFIIFNNLVPQNIYTDQIEEMGDSIQCDMPSMSFRGIAIFAGLLYKKITTPEELSAWLQMADFDKENYLVELQIAKDDRPLVGD